MPKGGVRPGAGRKKGSGYADQEKSKKMLADVFRTQNIERLKKKIASGNYSTYDMILLQSLRGEKTILNNFINKLVPTNIGLEHSGEINLTLAELTAKANTERERQEREAKKRS